MKLVTCVAALAIVTSTAASAADRIDIDRPGASDHPLVSRYAGSTLYQSGEEAVGSVRMMASEGGNPVERRVEGKVTNRMYFGPPGVAPADIFRNYQEAFRRAGFEVVYECDAARCERQHTQRKLSNWATYAAWTDNGKSNYYIIRIFQARPGFHYAHVKKDGPNGITHIHVALGAGNTGGPAAGRAQQFIQIVEPAKVELGKVAVDAQAIGTTLKAHGRIALYGVLFDTNEATIKPESADTLGEMAKALKNDPGLNVYIVGHTDNVGSVVANMALSKRRAEAVVEALTTRYGIAPGRVQAFGVASLAPTALNTSEDGRAQNRRVEMVIR